MSVRSRRTAELGARSQRRSAWCPASTESAVRPVRERRVPDIDRCLFGCAPAVAPLPADAAPVLTEWRLQEPSADVSQDEAGLAA